MRSTDNELLERVRTSLESKYQNSLYFYCSKEISKYLRSKTTSHQTALFHDYYYWDYVEEFMKRYYRKDEAQERILLLEDYFRKSRMYDQELPRVLPKRALLYKRTKRRLKKQRMMDQYFLTEGQGKDENYLADISSHELQDVLHGANRLEGEVSYETIPYDIYDQESEEGQMKQNRVEEARKIPTLPLIIEDREDPDEQIDLSEVGHLVIDFRSLKIPLIDFNSMQQRQSISSKQSQLKESGLQFRGKGEVIRDLKTDTYNMKASKQKPSGKKVYFVKGLRQRQNHIDWGTDKVLHEYFPQKKKTLHDEANNNSNSISSSNKPCKRIIGTNGSANRTPTSTRLHQLREKLKSLESRSSGLSQRISSLMTQRQHKKKIDYAQLIAKIKGTSHGKTRKTEVLRQAQSSQYIKPDKNFKQDRKTHEKNTERSSFKHLPKPKYRSTSNLADWEA